MGRDGGIVGFLCEFSKRARAHSFIHSFITFNRRSNVELSPRARDARRRACGAWDARWESVNV